MYESKMPIRADSHEATRHMAKLDAAIKAQFNLSLRQVDHPLQHLAHDSRCHPPDSNSRHLALLPYLRCASQLGCASKVNLSLRQVKGDLITPHNIAHSLCCTRPPVPPPLSCRLQGLGEPPSRSPPPHTVKDSHPTPSRCGERCLCRFYSSGW